MSPYCWLLLFVRLCWLCLFVDVYGVFLFVSRLVCYGKIMVEALSAFANAFVWKNCSNLEFMIPLSDYWSTQECKFTAIVLTLTLSLSNQLQSLNRRMLIESLSKDCLLFPHSSKKVLAQFHHVL